MDERDWSNVPLGLGETLEVAGCRIERADPPAALLVSGNLDAALRDLAGGAEAVGRAEEIGRGTAAIRIARDRCLVLSDADQGWPEGWSTPGYATSRATGLYAGLAITGDAAVNLLNQAMSFDPVEHSDSAAVWFLGKTALLVRRGAAFLLLVERPDLTEVSTFLRGAAAIDV